MTAMSTGTVIFWRPDITGLLMFFPHKEIHQTCFVHCCFLCVLLLMLCHEQYLTALACLLFRYLQLVMHTCLWCEILISVLKISEAWGWMGSVLRKDMYSSLGPWYNLILSMYFAAASIAVIVHYLSFDIDWYMICWFVYLLIHLVTCFSICLCYFIYLFIYQIIYLFIYLSVYLLILHSSSRKQCF